MLNDRGEFSAIHSCLSSRAFAAAFSNCASNDGQHMPDTYRVRIVVSAFNIVAHIIQIGLIVMVVTEGDLLGVLGKEKLQFRDETGNPACNSMAMVSNLPSPEVQAVTHRVLTRVDA